MKVTYSLKEISQNLIKRLKKSNTNFVKADVKR